jgi:hypothetical protein
MQSRRILRISKTNSWELKVSGRSKHHDLQETPARRPVELTSGSKHQETPHEQKLSSEEEIVQWSYKPPAEPRGAYFQKCAGFNPSRSSTRS